MSICSSLKSNEKVYVDEAHDWGRQYRLINNKLYCTKVLELDKPGVKGSYHKHKEKDEAWFVLNGSIYVYMNYKTRKLEAGDKVRISPGIPHQFWTEEGAVIIEGSTHDSDNDTYRMVGVKWVNPLGEEYVSKNEEAFRKYHHERSMTKH